MVMDSGQINTIYRLHDEGKWSARRFARKMVKRYLRAPAGRVIKGKL